MSAWFAVALGGALGSLGRYAAMSALGRWLGTEFPYGTLAVNVVGSFAMGLLMGLGALVRQPSAEVRAFLAVGVLGGFTTFSTFSSDVSVLMERGDLAAAAVYIGASVIASVGALFVGLWLVRTLAA